ncbi:probable methyltransferase-like protein 15 homolog [Athalia rosae]|uniref:probable methyltransferase-like protein 15 homolog n=1 Tax=Athalia rosae TaxID=37344 RepID=UPI002033769F|nr:probable methyltransferase-like protein 15 homolog [Athalia rosae]
MSLRRINVNLHLSLSNIKLYSKKLTFKNMRLESTLDQPRRSYQTNVAEKSVDLHHVPVLVDAVLEYLDPKPGQTIVDMTFGAGGHTKRILNSSSDIKIYALDRDPVAHNFAKELAKEYPGQVVPLLGRFSELPSLLKDHEVKQGTVDSFLFDFGCSSMQFDVADRGFAVSKDGPLDMRMDGFRCPETPTAADVLARADEEDLARILKIYGDEKLAKKIARAIIEVRYSFKKLETTQELAELVDTVCGGDQRKDQLGRHASMATKTFQALRIFVNNELNEINYGMNIAEKYLKLGGRLITIAFHSLEDTIVKRHISGNVSEYRANILPLRYSSHGICLQDSEVEYVMHSPWEMLHKHVIVPSEEEVLSNPRSRSAKLRAAICVK